MKKLITLVLTLLLVLSMAACSSESGNGESAYESALEVYTVMWDNVDEKFPVFGGTQDENVVMDGPAAYDVDDKEGMAYLLLISEDVQDSIDDVASMIHMMNANNYTGAVLHVSEGAVEDVAKKMEDTITNNQFMCGSPEKLVMIAIDDYLFYAYGSSETVDLLADSAEANLEGAVSVICDKALA